MRKGMPIEILKMAYENPIVFNKSDYYIGFYKMPHYFSITIKEPFDH